MHRHSGHHSAHVRWSIAKNPGLPLRYSDLVNAVTICPVCFEHCPRQLPKESGAFQWSSQPVRDLQIDCIGFFFPREHSKYAVVCVDTASGLTRAFPVTEQTRLPPLGKLVHGRDLAEQTVMGGSHAKDHSVRGWGKNVEGLQHHLP